MPMPRKPIDSGTRFGNLVVIGPGEDIAASDRPGRASSLCRCDCGREVTVSNSNLKRGTTKSCGCMTKKFLHDAQTKHGERFTRLYRTWSNIKDRCLNQNNASYSSYGGRGIKICDQWVDYEPFAEWARSNGYRDDLTIDRIDVNGDYTPENCRWVDWKTQANNKRNNHILSIDGVDHTLQELADISGNSFALILDRLGRGVCPKDAVFSSPLNRGPHVAGTHGVMLTAFGRTMNIKQWSEFLGVNRTTLSLNLKKGISIEKFVSDHSVIIKNDNLCSKGYPVIKEMKNDLVKRGLMDENGNQILRQTTPRYCDTAKIAIVQEALRK